MFRSLKIIILQLFLIFVVSSCNVYKLATGDFQEIQIKVDALEEKAIAGQEFKDEEKGFIRDLYGSLVFGGRLLGYKEAADMLERYLNASGESLRISEEIYIQNKKVEAAVQTIKKKINTDIRKGAVQEIYVSANITITHQENPRLFYFSNVFQLQAKPVKIEGRYCHIRWRVELTAKFPSYAEQKRLYGDNKYFRTPFVTNSKGQSFTIDDGLSHYLTILGMAKEFTYYAEWTTGI
jgi:hypothetical protein